MNAAYWTSTKTGVTMKQKSWLEVIASKEFGIEYMFMGLADKLKVLEKFKTRVANGIFKEAKPETAL